MPDQFKDYNDLLIRVSRTKFPGSSKLVTRLGTQQVSDFLSATTELNVAGLLVSKSARNLTYEQNHAIDFQFDQISLEVKNIHAKAYEKTEHQVVEGFKQLHGGATILQHKTFSFTEIEVTKNSLGTYSTTRTETGNSGFLASDLDQMSRILGYMGGYEQVPVTTGHKKVLFFANHTGGFKYLHIEDSVCWYFDLQHKNPHPIFENDPTWYQKMFGQSTKLMNIDAIVFFAMPTIEMLCWPNSRMSDIRNGKRRLSIYTKDSKLRQRLESYFL
jgi:hypothetical protein